MEIDEPEYLPVLEPQHMFAGGFGVPRHGDPLHTAEERATVWNRAREILGYTEIEDA